MSVVGKPDLEDGLQLFAPVPHRHVVQSSYLYAGEPLERVGGLGR